jgi:putative tricarboxylic transport membrane protein
MNWNRHRVDRHEKHVDLFWDLIASFWVGNILLVLLNVPMIGIWVKLLQVPYRYLFPAALFFIAVGVYSTNNSLFDIGEVLVFGVIGAVFVALDFPVAPILLGYVLGPLVEENFRRALVLSHGDMMVFIQRPISTAFMAICGLLIVVQVLMAVRGGLPQTETGGIGCGAGHSIRFGLVERKSLHARACRLFLWFLVEDSRKAKNKAR